MGFNLSIRWKDGQEIRKEERGRAREGGSKGGRGRESAGKRGGGGRDR